MKAFAIDIENGAMGWLLIDTGVRDWKPFPIDSAVPSPGPNYKRGFSILLYAPKLLGSPEAFDRSLRDRNPNWGLRNLETVAEMAKSVGFSAPAITEMPANNLSVVFRRM